MDSVQALRMMVLTAAVEGTVAVRTGRLNEHVGAPAPAVLLNSTADAPATCSQSEGSPPTRMKQTTTSVPTVIVPGVILTRSHLRPAR